MARRRERKFGPLADHVRMLPCCVPGCARLGVDAAHVRSRAIADAWIETQDGRRFGNLVPLCRDHHREQHRIGILTFQRRRSVDLVAEATKIGDRFLAGEDPCAIPW